MAVSSNAVDALLRCFTPVKAVVDHTGNESDSLALDLATHLGRPQFIVNLYFLSDVLLTLGDLSSAFQNNQVNLLSIEGLVKDKLFALKELRKDVFKRGYMIILADDHPDALSTI